MEAASPAFFCGNIADSRNPNYPINPCFSLLLSTTLKIDFAIILELQSKAIALPLASDKAILILIIN